MIKSNSTTTNITVHIFAIGCVVDDFAVFHRENAINTNATARSSRSVSRNCAIFHYELAGNINATTMETSTCFVVADCAILHYERVISNNTNSTTQTCPITANIAVVHRERFASASKINTAAVARRSVFVASRIAAYRAAGHCNRAVIDKNSDAVVV